MAFLGAFDDEPAFKQDLAKRRREAHVIDSEHFQSPRRFGFGPNPDSDSTRERFQRFRSLKPIFVVAVETGRSRPDAGPAVTDTSGDRHWPARHPEGEIGASC